jgi:hypothetical protein
MSVIIKKMSYIRDIICAIVLTISIPFAGHAEITPDTASGNYREVQKDNVYYNKDMKIVSDGKGYFYQIINGKYYPVETTYGSTYGYGGLYMYHPRGRNPKMKKAPAEKEIKNQEKFRWTESSREYPIYFN